MNRRFASLARLGEVEASVVEDAIRALKIDPERANPLLR